MFLRKLTTLAVLSLACAPIAIAVAQGTAGTGSTSAMSAGGMSVLLTQIGSTSVSALAQNYLNIKQCQENQTLQFQLNGIPGTLNVDAWIGDNACYSMTRTNTTLPGGCRYISEKQTEGMYDKFMFQVSAKDVVTNGDCTAMTESMPTLWFLGLNNGGMNSTEDASGPGNGYASYTALDVDLQPPEPPVNVTGGRGGSEIPIGWKTTDVHLQGFVVYVDATGMEAPATAPTDASVVDGAVLDGATQATDAAILPITDAAVRDAGSTDAGLDAGRVNIGTPGSGPCGPTLLVAGRTTVDLPTLDALKRKVINDRNATSTTVLPSDLNGQMMATVAVVSVDLAGNESVISNVVCAQFVKTTGFFDAYQKDGGVATGGCPCSAMGPVEIQNALPIGLSLLALLRSRRKRYS